MRKKLSHSRKLLQDLFMPPKMRINGVHGADERSPATCTCVSRAGEANRVFTSYERLHIIKKSKHKNQSVYCLVRPSVTWATQLLQRSDAFVRVPEKPQIYKSPRGPNVTSSIKQK